MMRINRKCVNGIGVRGWMGLLLVWLNISFTKVVLMIPGGWGGGGSAIMTSE